MKKIFLFTLIIIISCNQKNETIIETNTLLSEYTIALDERNRTDENTIYRHFCNYHPNDTFCIELTALRNACQDFLLLTRSSNLGENHFDTISKMYFHKMTIIKSIHDAHTDTSISKINILNIDDLHEEQETLIILMKSNLIINKHKAFGALASQIAICPPILDNERKCINGKPYIYGFQRQGTAH